MILQNLVFSLRRKIKLHILLHEDFDNLKLHHMTQNLWTSLIGLTFRARLKEKTLGLLQNLKNFGFYNIL